jgi:cytidylate kinase
VAKIAKVQAHQAEAIQQIRLREREAIEKFKQQYGIDPTRSSFFSYEGGGDAAGGGSAGSAGVF